MLITNFASGELSENLFGRIDLPQYFQGVSHLENFDVVPTGGISRRRGTRRIMGLPEEGRIIPFIIDRETHILLFLSPKKISVIVDGVITKTVESSANLPLYATMAEIDEVQYAQTNNNLIFVHKNYRPILVIYSTEDISIIRLNIDFSIKIISSENNIDLTGYYEDDMNYKKFFDIPGNHPSSVTFFNGRLIFGGTGVNKQRLFFSRINDISKFGTYSLFLTKVREYVSIKANLTEGSPEIVIDPNDTIMFKKPLIEYKIDSPFFPPFDGNNNITVLKNMQGIIITASQPANIITSLTEQQIEDTNTMIDNFNTLTQLETGVIIASFSSTGGLHYIEIRFGVILGRVKDIDPTAAASWQRHIILNYWVAINLQDNADYLYNLILNAFTDYYTNFSDSIYTDNLTVYYDNIYQAAEQWRQRILQTMQYNFRNTYIYNFPQQIRDYMETAVSQDGKVYLAFYTEEIIEDRHPTPDDGFTFEIASDMSDAIKWIGQNKNLLVGTETAEWVIPAGVNATNIQAILNSRYGSDNVQGTAIGDAFCFIQTGKKAIVEYYIPQQDNNFRANNMALLSKNMLHESPVFDFDFQSAPYTRIFISREDGKVACLLYERLTGTFAWGRITTTGHIRSVAVLPGDGQDEVYFVVERDGNFFMERLDGRDEVYLDGFHDGEPGPGEIQAGAHSGFPYTSRVRSMPILANDKMKNNVIKTLNIRFHKSYLPKVKSIVGVDREVQTDTIARKEPYSGIIQIPFPGQYDRDVFFEFVHDKPAACHILAVNAEAN